MLERRSPSPGCSSLKTLPITSADRRGYSTSSWPLRVTFHALGRVRGRYDVLAFSGGSGSVVGSATHPLRSPSSPTLDREDVLESCNPRSKPAICSLFFQNRSPDFLRNRSPQKEQRVGGQSRLCPVLEKGAPSPDPHTDSTAALPVACGVIESAVLRRPGEGSCSTHARFPRCGPILQPLSWQVIGAATVRERWDGMAMRTAPSRSRLPQSTWLAARPR